MAKIRRFTGKLEGFIAVSGKLKEPAYFEALARYVCDAKIRILGCRGKSAVPMLSC